MSKKTCLFILSPHRSGSSALSGVLSQNGIFFGSNLLSPAFDNSKGFFENPSIVKLNDDILHSLGYNWYEFEDLPECWWLDKKYTVFINRALRIISSDYTDQKLIGIKDPRISLLYPFWQYITHNLLEYKIETIMLLRNANSVVQSLVKRNNFTEAHSLFITLQYTLCILKYCNGIRPFVILFDDLFSNFDKELDGLANTLNLIKPLSKAFLDETMIEHTEQFNDQVDPNYVLLYSILEFALSQRNSQNRLNLDISSAEIDILYKRKLLPLSFKNKTDRSLLGLKLFSVFINNPINFIRKMNLSNFKTLRKAIKEEHPNTILKNLEDLL